MDVPIRLDMNSLVREQADEDTLRKIFEELEFRTLMERIFKKNHHLPPLSPVHYLIRKTARFKAISLKNLRPIIRMKKKSNLESLNSLSYDYQLIDTEEKRNEIIKNCLHPKFLR